MTNINTLILASINSILTETYKYNFNTDPFQYNLDVKRQFKDIIKSLKMDEAVTKIIESYNQTEEQFYLSITADLNAKSGYLEYEYEKEISTYKSLVENDNLYIYLLFVSNRLNKNQSFWINILKNSESKDSLKLMIQCIPDNIKFDPIFQLLCASHATSVGEECYNLPSIYGNEILQIPSIAIKFIKSTYYDLEYKKEVTNSILKVETNDIEYEKKYGKYIRANIEKLFLDPSFVDMFIDIDNNFISLLPLDLVNIEMLNKVIEKMLNQEYYTQNDYDTLNNILKIRTTIIANTNTQQKKQIK